MLKGAKGLAQKRAERPPLAVQETKKVLNYGRDATVEDGMNVAVLKNMSLFFSNDTIEAMTAFMEKRKPVFKGE